MTTFSSLCALVLVVFSTALARSQPVVSGVSGDIEHGAIMTITGSAFGVKDPAAPLKYDNFNHGTPGQELVGNATPGPLWSLWNNIDGDGAGTWNPQYSDEEPRYSGDIGALQQFGQKVGSHWTGYLSNSYNFV